MAGISKLLHQKPSCPPSVLIFFKKIVKQVKKTHNINVVFNRLTIIKIKQKQHFKKKS